MSDRSKIFPPTNCEGLRSAISLRESVSGQVRRALLVGSTTDHYGQVLAPASLSARQAKERGLLTSGTYGPHSSTSSESAVLQKCLENRLRARTVSPGWSLYKLTWKQRATPSGRPICALRASPIPKQRGEWAEHIYASVSIGEPAGWATPTTRDHKDGTAESCQNVPVNALLGRQVHLAGWPTPMAGTPAQNGNNAAGNNDSSRRTVSLAGWPTATAQDAARGTGTIRPHDTGKPLPQVASLTGSPAGTESSGRLRAGHSRWLMRIPAEWESCAPLATRSTKRPRKRS